MLLNSLYSIEEFQLNGQQVVSTIIIHPAHNIFKGHFPSQPVLPGVCLIEMLKDLIKKATGRSYTMTEASSIKYLIVVDPKQNDRIRFEIILNKTNDTLNVIATSFLEDDSINFKFKGIFA